MNVLCYTTSVTVVAAFRMVGALVQANISLYFAALNLFLTYLFVRIISFQDQDQLSFFHSYTNFVVPKLLKIDKNILHISYMDL